MLLYCLPVLVRRPAGHWGPGPGHVPVTSQPAAAALMPLTAINQTATLTSGQGPVQAELCPRDRLGSIPGRVTSSPGCPGCPLWTWSKPRRPVPPQPRPPRPPRPQPRLRRRLPPSRSKEGMQAKPRHRKDCCVRHGQPHGVAERGASNAHCTDPVPIRAFPLSCLVPAPAGTRAGALRVSSPGCRSPS